MNEQEGQARPDVLEGGRVRLRRSTADDADVVYLMARDPEVARYMQWTAHRGPDEAQDFLRASAAGWQSGRECHWMIESLDTGEAVGMLACRFEGAAADFGYVLAPHAWHRGYATDACATLVAWLKTAGFARIWAGTDHENARSAAVLERAGLGREGVLRGATVRPNLGGGPRDTLVYALCLDAM